MHQIWPWHLHGWDFSEAAQQVRHALIVSAAEAPRWEVSFHRDDSRSIRILVARSACVHIEVFPSEGAPGQLLVLALPAPLFLGTCDTSTGYCCQQVKIERGEHATYHAGSTFIRRWSGACGSAPQWRWFCHQLAQGRRPLHACQE